MSSKLRKQFHLFLILLNLSFSIQKYDKYNIRINIDQQSDLEPFFINDETNDSTCQQWIPSLFNPILLVPKIDINGGDVHTEFEIKNPLYSTAFSVQLFEEVKFLNEKYKSFCVKTKWALDYVSKCYLGLSPGLGGYNKLNEDENILSLLKNKGIIDEKLFSLDKWYINDKSINSFFYLGDSNEDFSSNKGIIGYCNNNPKEDLYWGCEFRELIFNNFSVPLKNEKESQYKVFFSTENHKIIFPKYFKEKFKNITNDVCTYDDLQPGLSCPGLFNEQKYIPIKFTHENMNITGEVDNINRFNEFDSENEYCTRIKFEDVEYIILPMIIFKRFHVQFNADKNIISFYTDDNSILEIKESNEKNETSSSGLKVLIIILIILLILILALLIYLFLNRKGSSLEKNVNKFSKFEDEEDFHNINENRVF